MMRLHFTDADFRQITLAPTLNALGEAMLSVRLLRAASIGRSRLRPGVQQLQRQVKGSLMERAGVLLHLVPAGGFVPEFLLQPDADDFATGVELARQTPAPKLAAELDVLPPAARASRWSRELATGAPEARRILAGDLHGYFGSSLAPLWPQLQADAVADRALRAETLLRGGIDALLTTLNANCRWQPPVLHIPIAGSYDVPLCGRGLLLIPSYFASDPMVMYRPDQSTVLVYPLYAGGRSSGPADALGPLLGRTRATVLAILRDPATTTAVAERAGVSLGSASQHATVLRNAGLISTTRMGSAVLHALTPLGEALLQGDSTVSSAPYRGAASRRSAAGPRPGPRSR